MDWSKAKNILIIALLITNLVLLGAIYHSREGSASNDGENRMNDTILLLKEHDIYVDEELIPERNQRLPVLSVRYQAADEEEIERTLEESRIALSQDAADEEYAQAANQLLQEAGISGEGFTHQKVQRLGDEVNVLYGVEYDGYSLDNARLLVSFRDGKPSSIGKSWAEAVTMGKNKKRVMTACTALIKFMSELESAAKDQPREAVMIDEIRLVYWLEGYTENGGVSEDTAVPYWCIRYNGDQRSYIAAYEQ